MGLSKDLKRMSSAIKAKFARRNRNSSKKGFNLMHFLIVVFSFVVIVYLFYHTFIRKSLNKGLT